MADNTVVIEDSVVYKLSFASHPHTFTALEEMIQMATGNTGVSKDGFMYLLTDQFKDKSRYQVGLDVTEQYMKEKNCNTFIDSVVVLDADGFNRYTGLPDDMFHFLYGVVTSCSSVILDGVRIKSVNYPDYWSK